MAGGRGEKLSEMALGWLLAQQDMTSVLIENWSITTRADPDNIKAIHPLNHLRRKSLLVGELMKLRLKIQPVHRFVNNDTNMQTSQYGSYLIFDG